MKTSLVAAQEERCSARFLLQKEKEVLPWTRVSFPGPGGVFEFCGFPREQLNRRGTRYGGRLYLCGRFYRPHQNFEDNQAAKRTLKSTRISPS